MNSFCDKSCIVTGGGGYIGSYLVRFLASVDYKVFAINRSTMNDCTSDSGIEIIHMDLSDTNEYAKLNEIKSKNVIHLAAQSSSSKSLVDPLKDIQDNILATLNMLKWSMENGVRNFIFASTMRVYGNYAGTLCEKVLCIPDSFYGVSKLAAENYVRLYADRGLNTAIFRLFNVYGPGTTAKNPPHGLVGSLFSSLLKKKPIISNGSLGRVRDLIHLSDVINVFLLALESGSVFNGGTYNLASGIPVTIGNLINVMVSAFGYKDYPVTENQMVEGDCFKILSDISKISSKLSWSPKITLSDGIQEMVDFHLYEKPCRTLRFGDYDKGVSLSN